MMSKKLTGARFDASTSTTFNRILDTLALRDKKTLDMGCGQGEHLIHFGAGSVGVTTTASEVAFGKQNDLHIVEGNVEQIDELPVVKDGGFEALWANNLFEHLLSPHAFLVKLKAVAKQGNETVLVLGVPMVPRIASLMKIRKFRGALAVAHVNFFTRETLKLTVERAGWTVLQIRPFVVSNAVIDQLLGFFAPHLYVVARNDTDFRYHKKKLAEWETDAQYKNLLHIVSRADSAAE